MIKKLLTCKTYLKGLDETRVVARLDSDKPDANLFVRDVDNDSYEELKDVPGVTLTVRRPRSCRNYLVGEIADRLYAYEQLGYSPEELKKIIEEHERLNVVTKACNEAVENMRRRVFVTTGRQNGKSLWDAYNVQRAMYDTMFPKENRDGLRAKVTLIDEMHGVKNHDPFEIENVIFNDPATIVFWNDGTKTVVKATNEDFDPEKGLAMAIAKKALGNKHEYYNVFKKWLKKYEKECKARTEKMKKFIDRVVLKKED